MTSEQTTAIVAAILLASPNTTWDLANPKARERAVDAAATLVRDAASRFNDLGLTEVPNTPGDKA